MVLQLVVSAIYQTVRHSWLFAAVAVKYILAAQLIEIIYRGGGLSEFSEKIMERSAAVVTGIVVAGFLLSLADYQPSPLLKPFSEFVALAYFAYLFWRY
ncbi:MAG: hypothetical protein ABEJ07_01285 [Candidatus Nanohaloarchaea archaeon]